VWTHARLLERAIFSYRFLGGSPTPILEILRSYQNPDGGFGQALEPDLRAPDSHPLFAEFALRTLYECRLREASLVYPLCEFLARHTDLQEGIPTIFPSSQNYPRADHWKGPYGIQPSMDRLIGLVGLACWQGVQHPWLKEAREVCLEKITATTFTDAHTLLTAFCLLESLAQEMDVSELFARLSRELFAADWFRLETPVVEYGLTPLTFAPAPDAFCRRMFTEAQIAAHLDDLASKQEEDGGWPVQWQPPGETALWEWRAQKTVSALATLRAYGRI
jgi:hypothetical protein